MKVKDLAYHLLNEGNVEDNVAFLIMTDIGVRKRAAELGSKLSDEECREVVESLDEFFENDGNNLLYDILDEEIEHLDRRRKGNYNEDK